LGGFIAGAIVIGATGIVAFFSPSSLFSFGDGCFV
jgi:hypothetical protein